MGWHEIKFNQGDFVEQPMEVPVKPTKFGGNLELEVPLKSNPLAKAREEGGALDSRSLSRWVPEMRAVARTLVVQVFNKDLKVPALRGQVTSLLEEIAGYVRKVLQSRNHIDGCSIHWPGHSQWTLLDLSRKPRALWLLVYVDDLMILSEDYIVQQVVEVLQKEWDTSIPEKIGGDKVKFLGMEIAEYDQGFFANQANYIHDKKDVEGFRKVKTPIR